MGEHGIVNRASELLPSPDMNHHPPSHLYTAHGCRFRRPLSSKLI